MEQSYVRKKQRTIVHLLILPILSIFYFDSIQPIFSDDNTCDAFATQIDALPLPIDPEMREFLKNKAIDIRVTWLKANEKNQNPISILAVYEKDDKAPWHFFCSPSNRSDEIIQLSALKLVESNLVGSQPPIKEKFGILFVFNSYRPVLTIEADQGKTKEGKKPDIDFGPYMALLQRTVKSNWELKDDPDKSLKADLEFRIKPDGTITGIELTKSSGISTYDAQAIEAINKSASFLPLPYPEEISIHYTFSYKPDSRLEKKSPENKKDKLYAVTLEKPLPITVDSVDLAKLMASFKKP